jgi:UDP-3-O-[3-hydroxymyristoyl] N-acetylglucosamine deacetylase
VQTTIGQTVSLTGKGLHTARAVRLTLSPAAAGHGIVFRRTDVTDRDNLIPARFDNVSDTLLCTRISNAAGVSVGTIEHLMAALSGCGVSNVLVDVSGPELPIMDGSARRFVREIVQAGVRPLYQPVQVLRVLKRIEVSQGDAVAVLEPSDSMEIDFAIDFADAAIGAQEKSLGMANGAFVHELADCRTFCRAEDVALMQSRGLALGGDLSNAVVVQGDRVLNQGGFRRADECVRHKMLDALGDLALAGAPILGRYTGIRAGHGVTNLLLRKLFATPDAYEMVPATDEILRRLPGAGVTLSDLQQAV